MSRIILILVLSVLLLIPVYIVIITLVKKINAWMNDITNWGFTDTDIKDQKEEQSIDADVVEESIRF